jgi:hypothetical protein
MGDGMKLILFRDKDRSIGGIWLRSDYSTETGPRDSRQCWPNVSRPFSMIRKGDEEPPGRLKVRVCNARPSSGLRQVKALSKPPG